MSQSNVLDEIAELGTLAPNAETKAFLSAARAKFRVVDVNLADLSDLADLICDRDHRKMPPSLQNIEACHALIIKMMGTHSLGYYSAPDGSEPKVSIAITLKKALDFIEGFDGDESQVGISQLIADLHAGISQLETDNATFARLVDACLLEHGGDGHDNECPVCVALADLEPA